jgi:2,5-diamino-6-(ribosylamino)-4(3H)-pyrimidinone 5'-phosphate reductase
MILAINMAMSLDGKVARPDGKWYGLSSQEDKKRMDFYRSKSEALIVGKNSIINDDPYIKIRYIDGALNPRPIILIRSGVVPKDRKVFEDSDHIPLIICTKSNEKEIKTQFENIAEIHAFDGDDIEPKKVIGLLKRLGYKQILLEGGPKINYSFFAEGYINRIHLTIVPFLIGQKSLPSILDGANPLDLFDKKSWKLTESIIVEDEIFLTYDKLKK